MPAGEGFKANALRKSSRIIAAHPAKITASRELKNTAGIGKGSMAYVRYSIQTPPSNLCMSWLLSVWQELSF